MQHNPSIPLFQFDASRWLIEPDAAFDAFLTEYSFAGRRLRPSSFVIYRGMFQRLRDWALEQGIDLLDIQARSIEKFLDGRRLGSETRHRYLLFFTTLFEHLALLHSEHHAVKQEALNPARSLLISRSAPERSAPDVLNENEVQQFIAALPQGSKWKTVRDQALALMVLGAGLRSAEVLALKTVDVHSKDDVAVTVWVRAHAPRPARKVPIHRWADPAISEWLKLREIYSRGEAPPNRGKEQRLAGDLLFPSGLSGGPMQPVTLFRLVKATLMETGIEKRYEGPTLLRNSCGALWLKNHVPQEVKLWMGHEQARTTELLLPPSARSNEGSTVQHRRQKRTAK